MSPAFVDKSMSMLLTSLAACLFFLLKRLEILWPLELFAVALLEALELSDGTLEMSAAEEFPVEGCLLVLVVVVVVVVVVEAS